MGKRFDYFIILAGMRTGSNFLEASLNQLPDIDVLGEAFNPTFVGHQKQKHLLGFDLRTREQSPLKLIEKISQAKDATAGFRFFHDHDPRVLRHCLADERCAKIVLTRDPLDSFVSLQIARATGQWRLTEGKGRKSAKILFVPEEFETFCTERRAFQQEISSALQKSGQAGFQISYSDLGNVDVLNGLAAYLGSDETMNAPSRKIKQQNPSDMREKVINYDEMISKLNGTVSIGTDAIDHEPAKGPGVPAFVVSDALKLIFAPLKSGPSEVVSASLSASGAMRTGLNQSELRNWKRDTEGHRSFTVLRHPLLRAFHVYQTYFIADNSDYQDLKIRLKDHQEVRFPPANAKSEDVRDGFESFLRFLKANLAGDTSIATDAIWASQSVLLDGVSNILHPDQVLREENLADGLSGLGILEIVKPSGSEDLGEKLREIYTDRVEKLCRSAYRKDYINFGFSSWD